MAEQPLTEEEIAFVRKAKAAAESTWGKLITDLAKNPYVTGAIGAALAALATYLAVPTPTPKVIEVPAKVMPVQEPPFQKGVTKPHD